MKRDSFSKNERHNRELSSAERRLSIVLPCYNEVEAVGPVLHRLAGLVNEWLHNEIELQEVIFVDDGSTDGTPGAVRDWVAGSGHVGFSVRMIQHGRRMGYGAAIKTGIGAAAGELIAFYDVDGTYDPQYIPSLVRAMSENSAIMACGDRLSLCQHMPLTREIGNRLFVGTINLLFGARVVDSCTGMRVFPRSMSDFFVHDRLPNGLDYSLALTLWFLKRGHGLVEIPIPYARRIGRSKLRVLSDGPLFYMRIIAAWLRPLQNPLKSK